MFVGVATIREKRPGVWEIRAYVGRDAKGRPRQVSRTVRGGKKDAQRVAAELTLRPATGSAARTVAEMLWEWAGLNEATWAERTQRDNRSRIRQIASDQVADMQVARLTVADIERWHARLRTAGVGPAAIRNRHSVLRAALDQAVRWGWLMVNVASMARLAMPRKADRSAMSPGDVRDLIEAAMSIELAAGVALRVAAISTARRSEIAALRWVDLDGCNLMIDSQIVELRSVREDGHATKLVDEITKTGNVRTVALDADTIALLHRLREERARFSPWLFSIFDEPPSPDRIGWWFSRAREISGVDKKWRLHDLRHWGATTGIGLGHDIRTVANRLGHANAGLTLRVYAHALPSADTALADTLGEALRTPTQDANG